MKTDIGSNQRSTADFHSVKMVKSYAKLHNLTNIRNSIIILTAHGFKENYLVLASCKSHYMYIKEKGIPVLIIEIVFCVG